MKEFKGFNGPFSTREQIGEWPIFADGEDVITCVMICGNEKRANEIVNRMNVLYSLQRLVEVYYDPTGKQWTTTSKKAAIAETGRRRGLWV